jgi:hypothetical protein
MADEIDWNGERVVIARSPSGVALFERWDGGLFKGEARTWPPPQVVTKTRAARHGVSVAAITWERIATWTGHPRQDEFARYLAWKANAARQSAAGVCAGTEASASVSSSTLT